MGQDEELRFRKAMGKRLAMLRHRKGLSQSQLRERIHKTKEYISLVENGHKTPNLLTLRHWAKVGLSVRLDAVIRGLP